MSETFKALLVSKGEQGYQAELVALPHEKLPAGDVTVDIEYSTLNYKDALAITGRGPIVRTFPMIPGIDLAGVISASDHPEIRPGDRVVLNGWGVGEQHWGGLAGKARVRGDWLVELSDGLSTREAMMIGTAGYTAMLAVMALEKYGIDPADGEVLVTGASGGVGSFAILILSRLGYRVVAATGRMHERPYLENLGAKDVIDRATLSEPGRPLQKERWAAAIDSVGSHTLANICAGIKPDGAVAACGMAQGLEFPASVAPFILRGVALLGINSVTRPKAQRIIAWKRLAELIKPADLEASVSEIGMSDVVAAAHRLLEGQVRGRIVVDVNA